MTTLRVLWSRVVAMLTTGRREAALRDEIKTHLDLLVQGHLQRRLSPEEARAAALRAFGGVDQVKESYRDQRGLPLVDGRRRCRGARAACRDHRSDGGPAPRVSEGGPA